MPKTAVETPKNLEALGEIRIRQIERGERNTFTSAWYAREGYDGILLLSQSLTDNLLYYQIPDVPIVHCIEKYPETPKFYT